MRFTEALKHQKSEREESRVPRGVKRGQSLDPTEAIGRQEDGEAGSSKSGGFGSCFPSSAFLVGLRPDPSAGEQPGVPKAEMALSRDHVVEDSHPEQGAGLAQAFGDGHVFGAG